MSIFVFLKEHVISVPTLFGMTDNKAVAEVDRATLRILR